MFTMTAFITALQEGNARHSRAGNSVKLISEGGCKKTRFLLPSFLQPHFLINFKKILFLIKNIRFNVDLIL